MIKVIVQKDCITIVGHACFDEHGKDIVCAAASATVLTTCNAILRLEKNSIDVIEEKDQWMIRVIKHSKDVDLLLENMILMLKELEKDYKKYIKIKEE